MDQSTDTTTNILATGSNPVVAIGGGLDLAGGVGAGAADAEAGAGAGKRAAEDVAAIDNEKEVSDCDEDYSFSLSCMHQRKRPKLNFLATCDELSKADSRNIGDLTLQAASMAHPLKSDGLIKNQAKAMEEIIKTGTDGSGIPMLLNTVSAKPTLTHYADHVHINRGEECKKIKVQLKDSYKIMVKGFNPDASNSLLRSNLAVRTDAKGVNTAIKTYEVMTPGEAAGVVPRSTPSISDNTNTVFVLTKHDAQLTVVKPSATRISNSVLSFPAQTSSVPTPYNPNKHDIFSAKPKELVMYGVQSMYGIRQPDGDFMIVGSMTEAKNAIGKWHIVIMPKQSSVRALNEMATSLAYHMPHSNLRKNMEGMLNILKGAQISMSEKKAVFASFTQKALESAQTIHRFSFFFKIADMSPHTDNMPQMPAVFSNCNAALLHLYQINNLHVLYPREKALTRLESIVWNCNNFGEETVEKTKQFHPCVTLSKFLEHFKENVATVSQSKYSRSSMGIIGLNTMTSLLIRDLADSFMDSLSYTGEKKTLITENMAAELEKQKLQGRVSDTTLMAAAALTVYRKRMSARDFVYPEQHCLSFGLCTYNELSNNIVANFFHVMTEMTYSNVSASNLVQEMFENSNSQLYWSNSNMFFELIVHLVMAIVCTHSKCEVTFEISDLCKALLAISEKKFVYSDTSLTENHRRVFSMYFLMSVVFTTLRTIDQLLFVPKRIPLSCIFIDGYDRSTPWYLLPALCMRKSSNVLESKTVYPNDIFFGPEHVIKCLAILESRMDENKTTLTETQILNSFQTLSAIDMKGSAIAFLNSLYDARNSTYLGMFQEEHRDKIYKEEMVWDDAVDTYSAPDVDDFSPTVVPTDFGLKGAWFPLPGRGDCPAQPSAPSKTATDEQLHNTRSNAGALPPPAAPLVGAAVPAVAAAAAAVPAVAAVAADVPAPEAGASAASVAGGGGN